MKNRILEKLLRERATFAEPELAINWCQCVLSAAADACKTMGYPVCEASLGRAIETLYNIANTHV